MRSTLRKIGNASGVIIPKPLLEEIKATTGDPVELVADGGRLTITPIRQAPRGGWSTAAATIAAVEEPDADWLGFANEAERGGSTVITKHGKAVAALVPIDDFNARGKQGSLLKLKGSGHGLWGADAARTIDTLRDEWSR